MKKTIQIYTDGACLRNPGNGGWAAILLYGPHRKELTGFEKDTTNNRMELMATIHALKSIKKEDIPIEIFTDSKYVRDGITVWIHRWKKNRWKSSSGKQVKNQKLWRELDSLVNKFKPTFNWVPGHSGVPENERADFLAKNAAKNNITPF
jgi:ribonuclease HI